MVKIQWGKVLLLKRKKRPKTQQAQPRPFNQIQTTTAMIIGKINMHQQQTAAIKHRLQKAKETWRQTKQKLFRNKTIPEKLRIHLWNALVRPTLTYALQTQEIAPAQKKQSINLRKNVCGTS